MSTMSAQNPHTHHEAPEAVVIEDGTPRRGTSPVLLMLFAFAVTMAAVMWWSQTRRASDVRPVVTTPVPAQTTERTAPAAERTAATERARTQRTASAPLNRDLRPLAGNAEPKYPASMLRAGVGGTVVVMAEVDAKGVPTEVRVVERSGERELDRAALSAVRQWRFQPALRDGKATASAVRVPVDFKPI